MKAYIIFVRRKITDTDQMTQYKTLAALSAHGHDPKGLVRYGRCEVLEGDPAESVTVLEFQNWDSARAWYDSAEYQAALVHRKNGSEYNVLLVEGVAPLGKEL